MAENVKGRWAQADSLFDFGVGILLMSSFAAFSKSRFAALVPPTFDARWFERLLSLVLLAIVGGLVFLWIFAVKGEMRLLKDHFHDFIQPVPGQALLWTLVFSALLGALGALTENIAGFALVFGIYSVGDIWGQWLRDTQIMRGVERARQAAKMESGENAGDGLLPGQIEVERYYLRRPHIHRSATIMFISFTALSLALLGGSAESPDTAIAFRLAGYSLMILNIVVSEIVIWRWRVSRDRALQETYLF